MRILTVFAVCFHYASPCGCSTGIGIREICHFRSDARMLCIDKDEFIEERQALDVNGKLFLLDKDMQEFELSKKTVGVAKRIINEATVSEGPTKDRGVEI